MSARLADRECAGCGDTFRPKRGYVRFCSHACAYEHRLLQLAHGHSRHGITSPTYNSWSGMVQRCTNERARTWANYGGRGITVCDRWRSFDNFLADMGERPAGKTLDRFPDNDGNYEPGNCRWASASEQAKNTTRTPRYTVGGKTMTGIELERHLGLARGVLRQRLKAGWLLQRAITTRNTKTAVEA